MEPNQWDSWKGRWGKKNIQTPPPQKNKKRRSLDSIGKRKPNDKALNSSLDISPSAVPTLKQLAGLSKAREVPGSNPSNGFATWEVPGSNSSNGENY